MADNKNKIPSIGFCRKSLRKVYPDADFEFEGKDTCHLNYRIKLQAGKVEIPVLTIRVKDGPVPSREQLAFAATVAGFRAQGFDAVFKPSRFFGGTWSFTPVKGYKGVEDLLDPAKAEDAVKQITGATDGGGAAATTSAAPKES